MKITLEPGQQLWFFSDPHYDHKNICYGTTTWGVSDPKTGLFVRDKERTRPFENLENMNWLLVQNINNSVKENDILICLGDWSFNGFDNIQKFRDRIICKNIHLVLGNHDHHIERNKNDIQSIFSSVHQYLWLDVKWSKGISKLEKVYRQSFVCFHYPIASWNGMNDGVIHLHGHVHLPHEHRVSQGKAMDCGVDGNNFKPISLDEIMSIMKNRPISKLTLPKDHHELGN